MLCIVKCTDTGLNVLKHNNDASGQEFVVHCKSTNDEEAILRKIIIFCWTYSKQIVLASIHPLYTAYPWVRGGLEPIPAHTGWRLDTPWAGHQSITGPWAIKRHQSTWFACFLEPTQTWEEHANFTQKGPRSPDPYYYNHGDMHTALIIGCVFINVTMITKAQHLLQHRGTVTEWVIQLFSITTRLTTSYHSFIIQCIPVFIYQWNNQMKPSVAVIIFLSHF